MGERIELTKTGKRALRILADLADHAPRRDAWFSTSAIGGGETTDCRKNLEPMGLVEIRRLGANWFKYRITDAGRSALEASK